MTGGSSPEPKSTTTQLTQLLNDAVIKNPVAAGLIGLGAVWLFAGSGLAAAGGAVKTGAKYAGEGIAAGASAATSALGGQLASASQGLEATARKVKDGVANALPAMGTSSVETESSPSPSSASQIVDQASDFGSELTARSSRMLDSARTTLTRTLERQPIILGGIGLAIGVGIAAAFQATQAERELVGDKARDLRDRVSNLSSQTLDTALQIKDDVVEAVTTEAQKQGFTASNLQQNLDMAGDKLKSIANDTQATVKQRL